MGRYVSQKCNHIRRQGVRLGAGTRQDGARGFKRLADAAHTVTAVKGRMEAHAFSNRFRQASAMACGSRAAVQRRKAAYAYGGRSVSASLNVTE